MSGKLLRFCAVGIAVTGLTTWTSIDAHAAVTYRTVAMTGQQAPGAEPGVTYRLFFSTQIAMNNAGEVAFGAALGGPGVEVSTNGMGLWWEGSGSLGLIARAGQDAPGAGPGVVYTSLSAPLLNNTGQFAFVGGLSGPGVDSTNSDGLWRGTAGSKELVVRNGDPAPGDPGDPSIFPQRGTIRGLSFTTFNDTGQIVFGDIVRLPANLGGTTIDSRIWLEESGSFQLVAQQGDPVPGMGPGVTFRGVGVTAINGAGQVLLSSGFATPEGHVFQGIWTGVPGSLNLVAQTGAQAAGAAPGVDFDVLNSPIFNNAGQTAFWARLVGPGVDDTNDEGLWSEGSGSLGLVAREGDQAPGTGPGVVFGEKFSSITFFGPRINTAGRIAFMGLLSGPSVELTNNLGLWSDGSGSLRLVAREGDPAPGAAVGEVFASVDFPSMNATGQVAFRGRVSGPGVDHTNEDGIWATELDGTLRLIARVGEMFDVNDDPLIDDFRMIQWVGFQNLSGGEDGWRRGFNDAGQLVFQLSFTDGSEGIFVATVPEPGTVAVLGVGVVWVLRRRR